MAPGRWTRRIGGGLAAVLLAGMAMLASAGPASAVQLNGGCQGGGNSLTKSGKPVDQALANAQGGTRGSKGDPFKVSYSGTVKYQGRSPTIFHNHKWRVKVYGITVKSGGAKNGTNRPGTAGTAKVDDYLPFKVTGLFYVSGGINAREGSCGGHMWVKLTGSPVGTLPWIGGLVVGAGGLALVVTSSPLVRRLGA